MKKLATKMLFLPPQLGLPRLYDICDPFFEKDNFHSSRSSMRGTTTLFLFVVDFFFFEG
jgi:hypothetical protein